MNNKKQINQKDCEIMGLEMRLAQFADGATKVIQGIKTRDKLMTAAAANDLKTLVDNYWGKEIGYEQD